MTEGDVDQETGSALAALSQQIASAGGTVILPANDPLTMNQTFAETVPLEKSTLPTIAYGTSPEEPGFHIMDNPTRQWSEVMTGLGASGVELIVAMCTTRAQQGHPFIPMLKATAYDPGSRPFHADMDILLAGNSQQRIEQLFAQLSAVLSRTMAPKLSRRRDIGFQITRGRLGVSL
jgi:hypothetical protein